jgi:hypothetical protein
MVRGQSPVGVPCQIKLNNKKEAFLQEKRKVFMAGAIAEILWENLFKNRGVLIQSTCADDGPGAALLQSCGAVFLLNSRRSWRFYLQPQTHRAVPERGAFPQKKAPAAPGEAGRRCTFCTLSSRRCPA